MDREIRQTRSVPAEFNTREDRETGDLYISGYFSVFNSNYEIFEGATESIAPTAFDGALSDDIRCLINHETRLVLGRNRAGTLTLRTDEKGLWGEVLINQKDTDAMNLYARVQRGDVTQCSFGFDILAETYTEDASGIHWEILSVRLYEVSIVTFPAYEDTSVTARKKDLENIKARKFEKWKSDFMKSREERKKEYGT